MTNPTDTRVRVFISWAHRHRDWTPAEEDAWRDTVIRFASALVESGIDTDIDLWHENDLGIDWTRWGQQRVEDSDHVLIAVNRAWAERWAGRNDPKEGAGAVMEADALHGLLTADQAVFQRKAIVITLPGADGGIPPDLARLIRRSIKTLDEAGISDIVRLLTGQSEWVRPPLGAVPRLLPRGAVLAKAPETPSEDQSHSAERDLVQPGITARTGTGDDVLSVPIDEGQRGRWLLLRIEGNPAERHFAVKSGSRGRALVNTTDRYRGSILVEPSSDSSLDLEITADGQWSFEVGDALTSARLLEGSLAGVGDDVLRWAGDRTSLQFRGNAPRRHFAVVAHMGGRRKSLINTTDPYSGRVLLPEGPALLSVLATGPWQCTVED